MQSPRGAWDGKSSGGVGSRPCIDSARSVQAEDEQEASGGANGIAKKISHRKRDARGRVTETSTAAIKASKELDKSQETFGQFSKHLSENRDAADQAARVLQRKCLTKVSNHCLNRERLIDRLELEAKLLRSLFMIMVYIILFFIMVFGDSLTSGGEVLSLNDFVSDQFKLGDLEEVTTIEEFNVYLADIEKTGRKLTPTSDMYFFEREEIKLIGPARLFPHGTQLVESNAIKVRVDMMEFSFTAWVNAAHPYAKGYIIRKPLAIAGLGKFYSCWGWYHHFRSPQFHFGAHDFGGLHTSTRQEYASVGRSQNHTTGWNLQTVVVRQDRIEFWQNRDLLQSVPIHRPVTDCTGNAYELGSERLELAMLIFYPYALSEFEIQEIFEDGSTLNAIALGINQYSPQEAQFEVISQSIDVTDEQFRAGWERFGYWIEIGHVLTREVSEASFENGTSHVVQAQVQHEVDDCAHSPACRFITGVREYRDPITGYSYYDLLPLSLSPNETMLGLRHYVHLARDRHAYNLTDFPEEIGDKFSFSFWAKPTVAGGYLIGKYRDTTHDDPCWSVYLSSDQVELHAFEDDHKVVLARVRLPANRDLNNYALTEGPMLRHMLLTVSEVDRRIRFYLDGQLVGEDEFKYPNIKHLNCPSDEHAYVAFMHRAPGSQDLIGEFQQVRLYAGTELSADDAHHLEDQSTDPERGVRLRECHYPGEISDDPFFADAQGHGCTWYGRTARYGMPGVCTAQYIKQSCPVACKMILPCLQPLVEGVERDVAWERVMHVMPPADSEPRGTPGDFDSSGGLGSSASSSPRRLAGGGGGGDGGSTASVRTYAVCLAEHVEPDGGQGHSTASSSHSSSDSSGHRRLGEPSTASSGGSTGGHPEPAIPKVNTDHAAIVQRCRDLRNANHPDYHLTEYRKQNLKHTDGFLYLLHTYPRFFLDVLDCEWLDRSIDDYCAFKVPHSWTTYFDQKIVASGEFTVTFWLKPFGPESLIDNSFRPTVQFFSELAPPDVFFTLFTLRGHSPRIEAYLHQHNNSGAHGIEVGATLAVDDWTHISLVFGAWDDKGHQQVSLMVNADFMTDYMPTKWVPSHSGIFLQAMVFSPDMLVSPVEFIDHAEPIEVLQQHYYDEFRIMTLRTGPLSKEHDRLHHKIEYELTTFTEPSYLGAPPIVLQDRRDRSAECPHESGTFAIEELWKKVVQGAKCAWPFDCDEDLQSGPEALFACSWVDVPKWHFGKGHHKQKVGSLADKEVFSEFLSTITRTPFVVRNGRQFETSHYFDQRTQHVTVNFMFVSPQMGAISELEITVDMTKPFNKLDYHMAHFIGPPDSKIAILIIVPILAAICGVLILGDGFIRLYKMLHGDELESPPSIVADVVIGAFVIVFYIVRATRVANLSSNTQSIIGRMMHLPWASHEYSFYEKEEEFFDVMGELETRIEEVNAMRLVFFALLLLSITRETFLLSAHPRVAMMVDTVDQCKRELWQLVMLWLLFIFAFGLIAKSLFGSRYHEFASIGKTLETEYLMFLGDVPPFFGNDWQITCGFLLYQFFMFFLLTNFLLAVLVDKFSEVKEKCMQLEVEQEFFHDLFTVCQVKFYRVRYSWPKNEDIAHGLKSLYGLKYVNVSRLGNENDYFGNIGMLHGMHSKKWTAQSRLTFCRFYGSKFSGLKYEYDPRTYRTNDLRSKQIKTLHESSKATRIMIDNIKKSMDKLVEDVHNFDSKKHADNLRPFFGRVCL